MNREEQGRRLSEAFEKLDATEQLIFMAGLQALAAKAFDLDAFTAWTGNRIDRHRAGEQLRVSDLETPPPSRCLGSTASC